MELQRYKTTNIYFINGQHFFIYWVNNESKSVLAFSDNFISDGLNKWILFFHENIIVFDLIKEGTILKIFNLIGTHNSAILWVDDFNSDSDYFNNSRRIILDRQKIAGAALIFSQDERLNKYQFNLERITGSIISIPNSNNLLLKRIDIANYLFTINATSCEFDSINIGLMQNTSCVQFNSHFKSETNSLDIAIPYISKKRFDDPDIEPIITSNFFSKKNLIDCILDAKYFPFTKSNKSRFGISTKNVNQSVRTNLLNEQGLHLETTEISKIIFSLSKTIINPDFPELNRYILYPSEGTIATNKQNSILGFSGTELFSLNQDIPGENISIQFQPTTEIMVNEKEIKLETLNDSKTSNIVFLKTHTYNLDSEKSPLFRNDKAESPYLFLNKAEATSQDNLPIIPIFAFKDNSDLIELEEVFKKVRLDRIKKKQIDQKFIELIEPHITPQGFLKTAETYDFIKPPKTAKHNANSFEKDSSFQFKLTDTHGDIDLSIRKDQVFFVLTPELFRQYLLQVPDPNASLEAVFQINRSAKIKFTVDLTDIFPNKTTAGKPLEHNSFIIFKFHREKASTLINDITTWTNHGNILSKDSEIIKGKINNAINFEDDYFKNSVLNDENWNGVVILNIPITKSENLPTIFTGLSSSQDFFEKKANRINLTTQLKFQYAAFPLNKTGVEEGKSSVEIKSTSFYGLIDYNPFANSDDYNAIQHNFKDNNEFDLKTDPYKFILSKLKVSFENSSIKKFESFAFVQIPGLFDDNVKFDPILLANAGYPSNPVSKNNLIKLQGSYQQNVNGSDEISFQIGIATKINWDDKTIIDCIDITKLGFYVELENFQNKEEDKFRFDIDAKINLSDSIKDTFSFDSLDFQNIGLTFNLKDFISPSIKIPKLIFDWSKLLVLPNISFNGNGFLRSFPIQFSHFKNYKFKRTKDNFDFFNNDFDFFKLPNIKLPDINVGEIGNLFSFIFDFDLGTLGNLEALKALKGQLLIGWSFKGGFALGFKLAGPSSDGLHLDLFGALKLDITDLKFGKFKPRDGAECTAYYLRLVDARLTVFGKQLPGEKNKFNGLIISDFSNPEKKIAWLINYDNQETGKLILGLGQRVGPDFKDANTTIEAIENVKKTFERPLKGIPDCQVTPKDLLYNPERNWLIASEAILPEDWPIELAFIFNDPVLYGIYLGFKGELLKGFSLDVLYKKLSENLGVYSLEWQLPDELRNHELGGAFIKLPNIGIDIYTNGDWKIDIGFPKNGNDWSRSGFIQLRTAPPFVGWFGFYMMASKVASLTLFKGYISDTYSNKGLQIIQAGFAMRVGIGFYFDKGILFVGASISVYGILEGAFAFEKTKSGLSKLFPDHFAVLGRVGAMAELVGYVDFGIIKASVYISLRVEFGLLLVYLSKNWDDYILIDSTKPDVPSNRILFNPNHPGQSKGIQPVKIYVEGEVRVEISIKIGCITIHLGFGAYVRFEFTIGGNGGNSLRKLDTNTPKTISYLKPLKEITSPINIESIGAIPMVYLPAFSRVKEKNEKGEYEEKLLLIHSFMIPFLGLGVTNNPPGSIKDKSIQFPDQNILKDKIILPFLQELIEKAPVLQEFEKLRHFLLTGKVKINETEDEKTMEIRFPNYLPTFIHGINSSEKDVVTNILTNKDFCFGFEKDNVKPNPDNPDDYSIINTHHKSDANSLLVIPAPISSRIQVVNDSKNEILGGYNPNEPSKNLEFDIELDWLVSDEAGIPKILKHIGKNELNEGDVKYIEAFYNEYKTQFIQKEKESKKQFKDDKFDKRDDIMIPEFFKLATLLTIERFHQFATNEFKGLADVNYKESNSINPIITIKGDTTEGEKLQFGYQYQYTITKNDGATEKRSVDTIWHSNDINNTLEDTAGQLNYFYNNGLRLPIKDGNKDTKSIYEFVDQYNTINLSNPIPTNDPAKVIVKLGGYNITKDVFATTAVINDPITVMWKFIEGFKEDKFNLDNIKSEFIRTDGSGNPAPDLPLIQFPDPFKLIPVTLGLQNSKQAIVDKDHNQHGRFFEIPAKLAQHGKASQAYSFKLNYADYKKQNADGTDKSEELTGVSRCLNIEMKVKRYETDNKSRLLEINNVFVDDLNLIYSLFNAGDAVSEINFYYKPEKDFDQSTPFIQVQQLNTIYATLLKTNLSPRTSPPIFQANSTKFKERDEEIKYWADSNADKINFIRLLWEGLTTNSGGYYIVMDNDNIPEFKNEKDEKVDTGTIIVSFVAAIQEPMPYYFNTIKIDPNETVFKGLDDKSHYLFIDQLNLVTRTGDVKQICEYHSLIPAHTVGFELKRDRAVNKQSNYQNYLPLEFELFELDQKGNPIEPVTLNADKVLPLMPASELDSEKKPKADKYIYNHLTPLVIQKPGEGIENYNRYDAVGKTYTLNVNVRDIFGFRTNEAKKYIASQKYTHHYFDKIIPIESWPLINFSYWLNAGSSKESLLFDLTCEHNILEILDLAGIPKKTDGSFKYNLGEAINDTDQGLLSHVIKDFSDNLNTIIAQLNDANLNLKVENNIDNKRNVKSELKNLLLLGVKKNFEIIIGLHRMPKKEEIDQARINAFVVKPPIAVDSLKTELQVSINITRDINRLDFDLAKNIFKADSNITELNSDNVWDYESVFKTSAKIRLLNTQNIKKSTLTDLNDAIRNATTIKSKTGKITSDISQYCLGIASEEFINETTGLKAGKIIYVVNEGKLSELKVFEEDIKNNQFKINKCYYGIKPFSNKLWSGDYTPGYESAPANPVNFSNIDLDKALRIILAKIDELLYANKVSNDINQTDPKKLEEIKKLYQKLITSKKLIADKKLKQLIGFVADDSVKPVNTLTNEFGDLILSGLNKFYAYDGVISARIDKASLKILDGTDVKNKHRLSINLKTENAYNLVSSKIGYSRTLQDVNDEWYILFDQKDKVEGSINFEVIPEITHLEYDISIPKNDKGSEIEHSNWIQLIKPVQFKINKYSVKQWPKIKREFPDKPVILKHSAEQSNLDDGVALDEWKIEKAGKWKYKVDIKNSYDIETDIIELKFEIKNAGSNKFSLLGEQENFEGFVSYWSSMILNVSDFISDKFIVDLYNELQKKPKDIQEEEFNEPEQPGFILKKDEKTGKWNKGNVVGLDPKKIIVAEDANDKTINIAINDFDIFEAEPKKRVVSILPIIKVYRNPSIPNIRFQYETESVKPVTPATPHIKYFNPIKLQGKFEDKVFNPIPSDLPFKSTAKYLIDTAGKSFPQTTKTLPLIPVQQIECDGKKPTLTDKLFDKFDPLNGYQAFSLTIYNKTYQDKDGNEISSESDLAVFSADTIFKLK